MTITEFLLARITEDEEWAKLAAFGWGATWKSVADHEDEWYTIKAEGKREVVGGEDSDIVAHIARHDPARVLAECAAKRALVVETSKWGHRYNDDDMWYSCGLATSWDDAEPGSGCSDESARGRCTCGLEQRVLRILGPLATVYADHQDYRQEWAEA